jgi:hypothetical protein
MFMANENRSNVAIPSEVFTTVTGLLNQAIAALQPYVTALTNEERQSLAKMSDKTLAFVQKNVGYSTSNPEFVLSYLNVDELEIDFGNAMQLDQLYKLAWQLCNNLNDTEMVAGHSSLSYYSNVKQGDKDGVPSARSIYEDLKKRFPARPKSQPAVAERA